MDMVPSKTVDVKGKKVRTTKSEKNEQQLPLHVLLLGTCYHHEGTTPRSIRGVKRSKGTVVTYVSEEG